MHYVSWGAIIRHVVLSRLRHCEQCAFRFQIMNYRGGERVDLPPRCNLSVSVRPNAWMRSLRPRLQE